MVVIEFRAAFAGAKRLKSSFYITIVIYIYFKTLCFVALLEAHLMKRRIRKFVKHIGLVFERFSIGLEPVQRFHKVSVNENAYRRLVRLHCYILSRQLVKFL